MSIRKIVGIGTLGVTLLAASSVRAQITQMPTEEVEASNGIEMSDEVEAIASHLIGTMDTTAQAANNPQFVGVQMTTCRITVTDGDEDSIYLYQEQALSENLVEPYRQRFLQIAPSENKQTENDRTASISFRPETPEQWTGLCVQPSPTISIAELGDPVCTVSLRESTIGGFVGSTPAGGCTANVRGATTITNVVVLHDDGMDTWDRGLNANGEQVWGAQDIPYQYRR